MEWVQYNVACQKSASWIANNWKFPVLHVGLKMHNAFGTWGPNALCANLSGYQRPLESLSQVMKKRELQWNFIHMNQPT